MPRKSRNAFFSHSGILMGSGSWSSSRISSARSLSMAAMSVGNI